jgi:hypothetical protein
MSSYTRQQYLDRECTHRQYYAQLVTEHTRERVAREIGLDRLLASTDEHLNDIPLKEWDRIKPSFNGPWPEGDHHSLAGAVCVNKEAARQIIDHAKDE